MLIKLFIKSAIVISINCFIFSSVIFTMIFAYIIGLTTERNTPTIFRIDIHRIFNLWPLV